MKGKVIVFSLFLFLFASVGFAQKKVLVRTLPYVAFATKPGVTMTSLGIPEDNENKKALDNQFDTTDEYIENSGDFQSTYLPYSDTGNLIAGILFYEEIMKSLHHLHLNYCSIKELA